LQIHKRNVRMMLSELLDGFTPGGGVQAFV
jgi:hypothetical protein